MFREEEVAQLRVRAVGPIVNLMGSGIFVLYIVNELYFRASNRRRRWKRAASARNRKVDEFRALDAEPKRLNPFDFFDFGVRRRFSGEWHEDVVETLARELPQ